MFDKLTKYANIYIIIIIVFFILLVVLLATINLGLKLFKKK